MAGFNPFAPQMEKKQGAPQLPGVPAPQQQAEQPGLMQTVAPAVFEKAMGSDEAGAIKDWGIGKAKEAWNAFQPTSPTAQSVMNTSIPVSELSSTMGTAISPSAMLGGGAEGAIAAQQAAQAAAMPAHLALGAETMAAGTGLATAATGTAATAGGALASAAPMAAALGPFGIPVLIGAGLLAANSGK